MHQAADCDGSCRHPGKGIEAAISRLMLELARWLRKLAGKLAALMLALAQRMFPGPVTAEAAAVAAMLTGQRYGSGAHCACREPAAGLAPGGP